MSKDSPDPADFKTRAEPQSLRGSNLQASLTVKDLQKSLAWYTDVLGFTVDQMRDSMQTVFLKAFFKLGDEIWQKTLCLGECECACRQRNTSERIETQGAFQVTVFDAVLL